MNIKKTSSRFILSLLAILSYGALVFAAPNLAVTPLGGYLPGTELDPICGPNTPDCIVQLPTASTTTAGTGLTLTGSTLAITPVGTAGTYGSATTIPVITTNNLGQITSITPTTITPAASSITGAQNVTAGSNKLTLGGTPTGAVLQPFSIDINEANLNLANLGGALNLTSQVTGILPVTNGGTGLTTIATGALLLGNGTSPLTALNVGTTNQVLSVASGTPTWTDMNTLALVTADNGLTATNGKVQLGGTLIQNTTINQAGYNTVFSGGRVGINTSSPLASLDVRNIAPVAGAVTQTVFSGTGINDITTSGSNSGNMAIDYRIVVTANDPAGDIFDIYVDPNGANTLVATGFQPAAMIGGSAPYVLNTGDGWSITFGTQTGYTIGDYWDWSVAPATGGASTDPIFAAGDTTRDFLNVHSDGVITMGGYTDMGTFYNDQGSSAYSVALGGGQALSNNMFVYGYQAGQNATGASNSNFIGIGAGNNATNANYSNFIGQQAGDGATYVSNSNLLGYAAGQYATNAYSSNFLGNGAGKNATEANNSNFLGYAAGQYASFAAYSNFLGQNAGDSATNASYSNFVGQFAGYGATNSFYSNFIGLQAGYNASDARSANFIGASAGQNATNANRSNFIGPLSGYNALNAEHSNFLGENAGNSATNANNSNFFGWNSGQNATDAHHSNFFGSGAGGIATNASYSNFIGFFAGANAANANNSIFIGYKSGLNDTVNNSSGGTSILIGDNTSTGGFSNSIALGKSATNTAANQLMIGSNASPINQLMLVGSYSGSCSLTITGMNCSSDERLKTNIVDLPQSTLDKVLTLKTVTYNWKEDPTGKSLIGFLAQDMQQHFPELVVTGYNDYLQVNYAGMTPILTKAIQELNIKLTAIESFANATNPTFVDQLRAWLGDVGNGVQKLFAREVSTDKLCIGDTCVTETQLKQLLQQQSGSLPASTLTVTSDTSVSSTSPVTDTATATTTTPVTTDTSPVGDVVSDPVPVDTTVTTPPDTTPVVSDSGVTP